MKIKCDCGAMIYDQTDFLPHKGHFTPDEDWHAMFDAMDNEVIIPLVEGTVAKKRALDLSRYVFDRVSEEIYQCSACGRLYIFDKAGVAQCYVPRDDATSKQILRSRGARR